MKERFQIIVWKTYKSILPRHIFGGTLNCFFKAHSLAVVFKPHDVHRRTFPIKVYNAYLYQSQLFLFEMLR